MSVPSMTMLPLSGFSRPISALRNTDFPVPDGPSITQISPAGIVRVTSPQMSCLPNDLVRSSTLISTPTDAPPLLCHWLDTPNPSARDVLRCAQAYQRVNKREVTARNVTPDTQCHSEFQLFRASCTGTGGLACAGGHGWWRAVAGSFGKRRTAALPGWGEPPSGGVAGCCWVLLGVRCSPQRARVT